VPGVIHTDREISAAVGLGFVNSAVGEEDVVCGSGSHRFDAYYGARYDIEHSHAEGAGDADQKRRT
jgi:hypothetical protein